MTIAQPRTVPNTRELRALLLAEERLEEIAASHRGGTYTVPSLHGEHSYPVNYTAREESCGCRDWEFDTPAITSWLRPSSVPRRASVLAADTASGIGSWSSASRAITTA